MQRSIAVSFSALASVAVLSLPTLVSNRGSGRLAPVARPNRDGVSAERGLLKDWPAGGPPLVLEDGGAGEGYSSFSTANGRLYTLGRAEAPSNVIAFDAATGKKLWGIRTRPTLQQRSRRRTARDADHRRRSALRVRGERRSQRRSMPRPARSCGASTCSSSSAAQNITLGIERVAAGPERSILVNAGAPGASIVAFEEGGRLADLEEPAGRSRILVRRSCRMSAACDRRSTSPVSARSGSMSSRVSCSGATTGSRTAPRTSRRRSSAATACSCRRHTGPAPHCSRCRRANGGISAREVYFTREMRNHHASSVLIGDYLCGFSDAILTAMQFDTGKVAWRDRSVGKGLGGVRGRSACISTARMAW